MEVVRRTSKSGLSLLFLLMIAMSFIAASPPETSGVYSWNNPTGLGKGTAGAQSDPPICSGSTYSDRRLDQIVGRSFMACSEPASLQGMVAELLKCNSWWGWFCASYSYYAQLDSTSHNGAGAWEMPSEGFYTSSPLQSGWYRVRTWHSVMWPGGSDSGDSAGSWTKID